jgi:hypothetical protein
LSYFWFKKSEFSVPNSSKKFLNDFIYHSEHIGNVQMEHAHQETPKKDTTQKNCVFFFNFQELFMGGSWALFQ